jgi:hypothetical protein
LPACAKSRGYTPRHTPDRPDRRKCPSHKAYRSIWRFHRIRHYGLFASGSRAANIARARQLLAVAPPLVEPEEKPAAPQEPHVLPCPCPPLRRPHDYHRGLRARLPADISAGADQDRHFMTAARMARCKAAPLPCRSSTGGDPARLASAHLWLIAPAEHPLDETGSLSSPSQKEAPPTSPCPIHHADDANRR